MYAGKFPPDWEKKMKVVNLPTPTKKCLASQFAKPKSTKRGDDSSETCSDIVPYKEGLPPIDNIVLESSPPPSIRTRSSRHFTEAKPRPPTSKSFVDAPPSSRTRGSQSRLSLSRGEYVISKFCFSFILVIYWAFL